MCDPVGTMPTTGQKSAYLNGDRYGEASESGDSNSPPQYDNAPGEESTGDILIGDDENCSEPA